MMANFKVQPQIDMQTTNYRICSKTVMDTSDPEIQFDENGVCHHYYNFHERVPKELHNGREGIKLAHKLAEDIKSETRNKPYDCIIGLSGGVDSSYVAHLVINVLKLRPLAIHMDNGWNSELAVANIENIVKRLNIDLHTEVLDWEEFRELQKALFRASVGNVEMATDHVINATLFRMTKKFGIRHIISGSNLNSEGILQSGGWAHDNKDWINMKDINKRFGTKHLKTYPHLSPFSFAYSILVKKVRFIPILNFFEFDKAKTMRFLETELGWRNYGRKHGESIFTRFFQEYYLPEKFNVDKRRSHLSTLICSGQISRKEAIAELEKPLLEDTEKEELIEFVCKKLEFSRTEWDEIMNTKPVPHTNFKTSTILSCRNNWFYRFGRKIATGRKEM